MLSDLESDISKGRAIENLKKRKNEGYNEKVTSYYTGSKAGCNCQWLSCFEIIPEERKCLINNLKS